MKFNLCPVQEDQFDVVTLKPLLIELTIALLLIGIGIWLCTVKAIGSSMIEIELRLCLLVVARVGCFVLASAFLFPAAMSLGNIRYFRRRYGPNYRSVLAKQFEQLGWNDGPNGVS